MELTGKKEYSGVKVSIVREFYGRVSYFVGKRGLNVIAQNKIAASYENLKSIVDDANAAIVALGAEPSQAALAAIENAKVAVAFYEIDTFKEWDSRNAPIDIVTLRAAKLVSDAE